LSGRGNTTLVAHGLTVTFDARESGYTLFTISGVTPWKDARYAQVLRLLPGAHYVVTPDGRKLPFRVTDAGQVDYDPSLDGVLSGRGGSTLTIRKGSP
jgi:hypothetical protein